METVLFERAHLYKMYDDEIDLIIELFNEYLSNFSSMVTSLKESFADSIEEFEKSLHYHGSSFQYVGFSSVLVECHEMEKKCKLFSLQELETDFHNLMNKIGQTYEIINNEVLNLKKEIAS
jgi:hypothetical protein